jgi:formamidopyrimidine-DNA glycosylase
MPELPEVETIVREMSRVKGYEIRKIWSSTPKLFNDAQGRISKKKFENLIKGKKVEKVFRRGKFVVVDLSGNCLLVVHLKMTGALLWRNQKDREDRYVRAKIVLDRGKEIRFSDVRKFGKMWVIKEEELVKIVGHLGREPLERSFTQKVFLELMKRKKGNIKQFLMDQEVVVGIGNIYANEILFEARIHPDSLVNKIPLRKKIDLYQTTRVVLKRAIKAKGSSNENYLDFDGREGNFQKLQKVYRRKGEPCVRCKKIIERKVIGQRGTFFCANCQICYK